MATWLNVDQVADLLYSVGFRGQALAIAVAVSRAEAGGGAPEGMWANAGAVGDLAIQNDVWGPSLGFMQIRTVKAEQGKWDGVRVYRDADALRDPQKQAGAALRIVGGGTVATGSSRPNRGWGHWSVWKDRKHTPFMATATMAADRRQSHGGSGLVGNYNLVSPDAGWPSSTGSSNSPNPTSADAAERNANGDTANMPPDPNLGTESPDVVPRPAGTFPTGYRKPRAIADLRITGGGPDLLDRFRLADVVLGGDVDLTLERTSEIRLDLVDPGNQLLRQSFADFGRIIEWSGLRFMVAAVETGGGPPYTGGDAPPSNHPRLVLTGRDPGVEKLRQTNAWRGLTGTQQVGEAEGPSGAPIPTGALSPTEYAAMQARWAGLGFRGKGSARVGDIAPTKDENTGIYESPWEVLNRLAGDLGYWCFVSRGTLYFAPPVWLAWRAMQIPVGWRNAHRNRAFDALVIPEFRDTLDNFTGATIDVQLPRWRGEMVRPGDVLQVKGTAGDTRFGNGPFIVTEVKWPVDGGFAPVDVHAVQPVDPVVHSKKPATAAGGSGVAGTSDSGSGSSGSSGSSGGSSSGGSSGTRLSERDTIALYGPPGDTSRIVTVRTPWGFSTQVHILIRDRFLRACARAQAQSNWVPKQMQGYNKRKIAGSNRWSQHSWALAWDTFDVPYGSAIDPTGPRNAPDEAFRRAFSALGFVSGADWNSWKDYPHLEWVDRPPTGSGGAGQDA